MGCNFCTTSAFFGGKGKMLNLYSTGEELFRLMEEAEASRNVKSFFIMDENFLLQRQRAMDLLARMKAAGKSWAFNIFSSANAIRKYTYEELVELGVSSIWLGLESAQSGYAKLEGADTLQLTRELREHGIVLLGSTILGLEHHTPENIDEEIEHAIAHQTDLHQFMLYTPVPGTPLYREMEDAGPAARCRPGRHPWPGRLQFPARGDLARGVQKVPRLGFPAGLRAQRPESLPRLPHHLRGMEAAQEPSGPARAGAHSPRSQDAAARLCRAYSGPWSTGSATRTVRWRSRIRALRKEIEQEFGFVAVAASRILGPVLWWTSLREDKRLARGQRYEPPTIIGRRNWVET